jgi:acetyl-CoA synthetase
VTAFWFFHFCHAGLVVSELASGVQPHWSDEPLLNTAQEMQMSQNESVTLFQPPAEFVKQATISGMDAYNALCAEAANDYTGYWARLAREHVSWKQPFTQVLDESDAPFFKWFADGKLNASYNCLDRNVEAGLGDKVAIISETDDGEVRKVTYKELLAKVSQLANGLRAKGIKKGDRVIIYMAMGIEGVVAMQACARIGAIHSVVFGGFSAQSVRDRINDAGAVAVITTDEQCRGGKKLPLKPAVDEGIALGGCESIKTVIVFKRTGGACPMLAGRDFWWDDVIAGQSDVCEPEWVEAEHPLFLLYTSGSTGKPKGVQHSTGGYLLHAVLTMKWTFDLKPRYFLVYRRYWLGNRPYLHHLWPAGLWRDADGLRGRAGLSRCRAFLEDDPESQDHDFLYGADGYSLADQGV